jgi:hypothetical protein
MYMLRAGPSMSNHNYPDTMKIKSSLHMQFAGPLVLLARVGPSNLAMRDL